MWAWEAVARQRRVLETGVVIKNSRKLYLLCVMGIPTALLYDSIGLFSANSDHRYFTNFHTKIFPTLILKVDSKHSWNLSSWLFWSSWWSQPSQLFPNSTNRLANRSSRKVSRYLISARPYILYVCDYINDEYLDVFEQYCEEEKECAILDVFLKTSRTLMTCIRCWHSLSAWILINICWFSTLKTSKNSRFHSTAQSKVCFPLFSWRYLGVFW